MSIASISALADITPELFGAVGDGVVNDRAAIQAAIDYAQQSGTGRVIFPAAAYAVWMTPRTSDAGVPDGDRASLHRYDGNGLIVRAGTAGKVGFDLSLALRGEAKGDGLVGHDRLLRLVARSDAVRIVLPTLGHRRGKS